MVFEPLLENGALDGAHRRGTDDLAFLLLGAAVNRIRDHGQRPEPFMLALATVLASSPLDVAWNGGAVPTSRSLAIRA